MPKQRMSRSGSTGGVASGKPKVVSRVFKVFRFEAHPRKRVLTIIGEVALTYVDTGKKTIEFQHLEEFKKRVELDNLSADTSTEVVEAKILKYCPFIDDTLLIQLRNTIEELKTRNYDALGEASISQRASDGSFLPRFPDMIDNFDRMMNPSNLESTSEMKIDINNLDNYVELLYEDLDSKIKAAYFIFNLTKVHSNLIVVASHETAMNALMRTLREESTKSVPLSTVILNICLHFARVPDFHDLLYTHDILSIIGNIITTESQKHDKTTLQMCKNLDDEHKTTTGKISSKSKKEAKLKMELCESVVQQDELIRISFTILYEMVNDLSLLHQICGVEVIKALIDSLERENVGLLEIVLMTLKNLSIFKEAVEIMTSLNLIDFLTNILKSGTPMPKKLVSICFHLIFNLTFDSQMRQNIVESGLLTSFSNCMKSSELEGIAIKILYNISMDAIHREKFEAIAPNVLDKVLENKNKRVTLELGALITNLARNKDCAIIFCKGGNINRLLAQAVSAEDELLMKAIRNLAEINEGADLKGCALKDIACAIVDSKANEFVVECVGTMGHLDANVVDFYELFKEFDLIPFFRLVLEEGVIYLDKGGELKSPMLIDVVSLIGTCVGNPKAAGLLVGDGIMDLLLNLLCSLGEDDKMQEQILYALCKLIEHDFTRAYVVEKTEVPDALLSLFPNAKPEVQDMCATAMSLLSRYNNFWYHKIKEAFFVMSNKKWIQSVDDNVVDKSPRSTLSVREKLAEVGLMVNINEDDDEDSFSDHASDEDQEGSEAAELKNGIYNIVQKQFQEEMAAKQRHLSVDSVDSGSSESELETMDEGEEELSDVTDVELNTDDSYKT